MPTFPCYLKPLSLNCHKTLSASFNGLDQEHLSSKAFRNIADTLFLCQNQKYRRELKIINKLFSRLITQRSGQYL